MDIQMDNLMRLRNSCDRRHLTFSNLIVHCGQMEVFDEGVNDDGPALIRIERFSPLERFGSCGRWTDFEMTCQLLLGGISRGERDLS